MTSTSISKSKAVMEGTRLFTPEITNNYTGSLHFMKQLTVVTLSTITFMKCDIPEDNYNIETFAGIKIRILKAQCKDELPKFLSTGLTEAFDALDKKYLHQILLCFYEGDCTLQNMLQYHIFQYSYREEGIAMTIKSKSRVSGQSSVKCTFDDIRAQTEHLIRTCVVLMQDWPQLPETCEVALRLCYNEKAPAGYQAPGYVAMNDPDDLVEAMLKQSLKLGSVNTPYHTLAVRSFGKDDLRASHEGIASLNPPTMSQEPEEFIPSEDGTPLRCVCNNHDDGEELLTCRYCNTVQHAVCYGVLPQHASPVTSHCCVRCADHDVTRVTDPSLAAMPVNKRNCYAIFRRTLRWCSDRAGMSARELSLYLSLSAVSARKLMKLLQNTRVIHLPADSDLTTSATIDQYQLQKMLPDYFTTSEDDITTRLVAETFASQEASDPVGDVLKPLEKASLHDASNLGRVVNQSQEAPVEDATLKQYRDAIVVGEKLGDDVSLSGDHNPVKDINEIGKELKRRDLEGKEKTRGRVRTKKAKVIPTYYYY